MNSSRHTTLVLAMFATLVFVAGCGGDSHSSTSESSTGAATDLQHSAGLENHPQEKSSQKASADAQHRADQRPSPPGRTGSQPKQHRVQNTPADKQHASGVVEDLLDEASHTPGGAETRVGEDARRILEEALEQGKADGENEGKPSESNQDGAGIVEQLLQQTVKQR